RSRGRRRVVPRTGGRGMVRNEASSRRAGRTSSVSSDDRRSAMRNGWSTGAENVATAEPMHPDRLSLMNSFYRCRVFSDTDWRETDGFIAQVLSTLLWSVMVAADPNLIANVQRHPFNLKSGEI